MDTLCRVCRCVDSAWIYIHCQVSGEYNKLRVSIANTLLRWYRSVKDVLRHRVCDLSPWERGVRMRTLPAYVIRCLQGYGYPVHGMWVCRLCKGIHFLYWPEYSNLPVRHGHTLPRWYHPVQHVVLPNRVCAPAPWEHWVRITTLPLYVQCMVSVTCQCTDEPFDMIFVERRMKRMLKNKANISRFLWCFTYDRELNLFWTEVKLIAVGVRSYNIQYIGMGYWRNNGRNPVFYFL